jgi:hypothetical protein
MATTHDQLAAAIKAAEEANKKVDELKKLSRNADLDIVKALIKTHGFGPTDLRGVLKAKRKRKPGGNAVRKTPATSRKVTAAKKVKTQSKSKSSS